jgi:site-specific DNA-methyltransferase (adenine-specific)
MAALPRFDSSDVISGPGEEPVLTTARGALFHEDCLSFLSRVDDRVVDTVFADPPFNLGKVYGPRVDDGMTEDDYIEWGRAWIDECVRVLKPGGSFFLYNLPRWNVVFGAHLMDKGLDFRHWIAISIKSGLPIPGRLYPAHYSLLYYTKGKPSTFRKIRTPIETCRHCGGEIKDYGGHRNAMNPDGVNLTDVWSDIPPVRHWKFKSKKRNSNQLSTKLLERVMHLTTTEGSLLLDPFGGSGTTFAVAEQHDRYWIGSEIENCDVIVERLSDAAIHHHSNDDWVESVAA